MSLLAITFLSAIALLIAAGFATGAAVAVAAQPVVPPLTPINANQTGQFMFHSDGSLTGMAISQFINTWPGASADYPNGKLWNICTAVALAEGFQQGVGTAPYDLNNPGDLSPGDENGQSTCGLPQQHGGSSIILFCTVEEGFIALYKKFERIVDGASSVYPKEATWEEVAIKYAGNYGAWLNNVTSYLGVDSQSTPADYANS